MLVIDAGQWGDDVRLSDLEPKSRARPAVAAAPMSDRYLSGPGWERETPNGSIPHLDPASLTHRRRSDLTGPNDGGACATKAPASRPRPL
jgi:hypothetical protein